MNPLLEQLRPYPFGRLNTLKHDLEPPAGLKPIVLSMGEPKHPPPDFILEAIKTSAMAVDRYPSTKGEDVLRSVCAQWLEHRFDLTEGCVDPNRQVLPLNGTREGLFGIAQTILDSAKNPLVLLPNPFYQIYEGAALLAGAKPYYLNTTADQNFLPDLESVPADVWRRCELIYVCSPGNPTGAVADLVFYRQLQDLAQQYDFIIVSDECYSEIYSDQHEPPLGLLQACQALGNTQFARCLVFHSLSKRSNVPGLRSGFVAGDEKILKSFLEYRIYAGGAMPPVTQFVSALAWQDETHVKENRRLYAEKFNAVVQLLKTVLPVEVPTASFYLWPEVPINDEDFTRNLYRATNVTVLPGSYLARNTEQGNPGQNRVRISLVAALDECVEAAKRIVSFMTRS